jgi:hypothetical protein
MSTTLHDAFTEGKPIATVDSKEYRLVSIVCVRAPDGVISFYCKAQDWQTTPVALLAKRDAEIEALKQHIAELEDEREAQRMRSLVEKSEPITVEEAVKMTAPPVQNGVPLACPECKKEFLSALGLIGHASKKHGLRMTHTQARQQKVS